MHFESESRSKRRLSSIFSNVSHDLTTAGVIKEAVTTSDEEIIVLPDTSHATDGKERSLPLQFVWYDVDVGKSATNDDYDDSYDEALESSASKITSNIEDLLQSQLKLPSTDYGVYDTHSSDRTSYRKLSEYVEKESSRPTSSASRVSSRSGRWNEQVVSATNLTQHSRSPSLSISAHFNSAKNDSRPASTSKVATRTDNGGESSRPSSSINKGSSFSITTKESPRASLYSRENQAPSLEEKDYLRPPTSTNRDSIGVVSDRESSRPSSRANDVISGYTFSGMALSRPPSSSKAHSVTAGGLSRPTSASAASNFLKIEDNPVATVEPLQRKNSSPYYIDSSTNILDVAHRPASSGSRVDYDVGKPWTRQSKMSGYTDTSPGLEYQPSRAESRQSNAETRNPRLSSEIHTDGSEFYLALPMPNKFV